MASRPLRFHPAKIVRTSRTISSTTTFAAKIAKHPWMWRLATSVHPDDLFDMRCAARKILVSPFDHILVGKAHEKNAFNLRFSLSLSFWDSPTKQPSIIDNCDKVRDKNAFDFAIFGGAFMLNAVQAHRQRSDSLLLQTETPGDNDF